MDGTTPAPQQRSGLLRSVGWYSAAPARVIRVQRVAHDHLRGWNGRIDVAFRDRGPITHAALVWRPVTLRPELRDFVFAVDIRVSSKGGWFTSIHLLDTPWDEKNWSVALSKCDWNEAKVIAAVAQYNEGFGTYDSLFRNCRHWAAGLGPFMAATAPQLTDLPTEPMTTDQLANFGRSYQQQVQVVEDTPVSLLGVEKMP